MTTPAVAQRGLSLVELLISMTLGLLLLSTLISIYLAVKQTYSMQDNLARMQENARLALRLISHDIRMAGYWGDAVQYWNLHESTDMPLGIVSGECHVAWAHAPALPADGVLAPALTGSNGSRGAFASCISASEHIAGTDILSAHFTSANPIADSAIEMGKVYLRVNLLGGLLFKANADRALPADFTTGGIARNYRAMAVTYYLRPWSTTPPSKTKPSGDGIPTLMRATLSDCGAGTCVKSEALVEGVASMQIQYGLDQGAGVHNYVNADQLGDFTTPAAKAQWQRIRAARIGLLVRALAPDANYIDSNAPYLLGDQSVSVAAGYRHIWLTSTVALRNRGD